MVITQMVKNINDSNSATNSIKNKYCIIYGLQHHKTQLTTNIYTLQHMYLHFSLKQIKTEATSEWKMGG